MMRVAYDGKYVNDLPINPVLHQLFNASLLCLYSSNIIFIVLLKRIVQIFVIHLLEMFQPIRYLIFIKQKNKYKVVV